MPLSGLVAPRKPIRELDQFDEAWRNIHDAMSAIEDTKERWWEAE